MSMMGISIVAAAAPAAAGPERAPAAPDEARTAVLQQGKGQGEARGRGAGQGGRETRGRSDAGRGRAARTQPSGRGQETRGRGQAGRGERDGSRGRSAARPSPGRGEGRARSEARADRGRSAVARTSRASGRAGRATSAALVGRAVERGRGRGAEPNAFTARSDGSRTRLLNRRGEVLLDMDDDRAREIGAWRMRRLGDRRPTANAPAFCRSGEGHPVWGREWCLQKGFGLGSRPGTLWSRSRVDDIRFLRPVEGLRLDRPGLIEVLGDLVLGRLALHAVTLGYQEPLAGVWVAEPSSPRLLRLYSGDRPVAEFVEYDRDDRVEVLYVVQPL